MSITFAEVPSGGNAWFKAPDHGDDFALLVEVKGWERQRPTPMGPKDSALCDVTVFATEADLAAGKPSEILDSTRIEYTALARDLENLVGQATIATLEQVPSKKVGHKPAWVFRNPSNEIKLKVIEYATAREAALKEAVAAAPSFD